MEKVPANRVLNFYLYWKSYTTCRFILDFHLQYTTRLIFITFPFNWIHRSVTLRVDFDSSAEYINYRTCSRWVRLGHAFYRIRSSRICFWCFFIILFNPSLPYIKKKKKNYWEMLCTPLVVRHFNFKTIFTLKVRCEISYLIAPSKLQCKRKNKRKKSRQ